MNTQYRFRSLIAAAGLAVTLMAGTGNLLAQSPTSEACPGTPVSRIAVGTQAVVPDGISANVRTGVGVNNKVLAILKPGQIVDIVNGPRCVDGYLWWEISLNSQFGFVAEGKGNTYFLEPGALAPISTTDNGIVSVNHNGISFQFDSALAPAAGVEASAHPAEVYGSLPAPEGIEFVLFDGTENSEYPRSSVNVYPAEGFAPLDQSTGEQLDALKAIISGQASISENGHGITGVDGIPEVPQIYARQMMHAAVKFVTMADGGKGIRFLTWYAPTITYLEKDNLRYEFRGISADGTEYIKAEFPITSSILPGSVSADDMNHQLSADGALEKYIADWNSTLTALPAEQFDPHLDQLDALVASLDFPKG